MIKKMTAKEALTLTKYGLVGGICALSSFMYAQTPIPPPPFEPDPQFDISPHQERVKPVQRLGGAAPKKTLEISREQLLQNPVLLHRALTSSVVLGNVDAVRLLLPIYRQSALPLDNDLLKLSEAMLARADGKYTLAVKLYRNVLSEHPDLPFVRMLLAESLFENYQNQSAYDQFTRLRSEKNLPPEMTQKIDHYLTALSRRNEWYFDAAVNYIRDDNLNNVSDQREIQSGNGTWTLPEKESGEGITYRLVLGRDWRLYENWSLRTEANMNGKLFWNNHNYDDRIMRYSTGAVYRTARMEIALLPYYERRFYGDKAYSKEKGVRAEYAYWLSPHHKLLGAAEYGFTRHDTRNWLNGNNKTVSLSWVFMQNPQQYFVIGADYYRRKAQDRSDAYWRGAGRISWTREWVHSLSTQLTFGYGVRRYDQADLMNVLRRDKEYSVSLGVWSRKIHLFGVTPRVVLAWHKNDSNNFMYQYDKTNVYLQFSKTF